METLIELLRKVEEDDTIQKQGTYLDPEIPIIDEISNLAERFLITKGGFCHWSNIHFLEDMGFKAFPLERDSFGWLSGGIQTKKGVITYG